MSYSDCRYNPASEKWQSYWNTRDSDGYEAPALLWSATLSGGDWTSESAAIFKTVDGKFWSAYQPGGCSCVSGESPHDIEGPFETYAEAWENLPTAEAKEELREPSD